MRKRLHLTAILQGLLFTMLGGCAESPPTTAPPATTNPAESTTGDLGQSSAFPGGKVQLRIAAASDLKFALPEVIAAYQKLHPEVTVEPTFGASGTLFAQLSEGAPFDLFLSADESYPQKLIESGQALPDSQFSYAVGHLVLWVSQDSPLDITRGQEILTDPQVQKISLANPQHAPYGRAAKAALTTWGLDETLKDKLVLGENVAQAAQYVESGAAQAGLIGLSLALSPALKDKGKYWEVPADAHPPLQQAGVILKQSQSVEAAREFGKYLQSEAALELLRQFGFTEPAPMTAKD